MSSVWLLGEVLSVLLLHYHLLKTTIQK